MNGCGVLFCLHDGCSPHCGSLVLVICVINQRAILSVFPWKPLVNLDVRCKMINKCSFINGQIKSEENHFYFFTSAPILKTHLWGNGNRLEDLPRMKFRSGRCTRTRPPSLPAQKTLFEWRFNSQSFGWPGTLKSKRGRAACCLPGRSRCCCRELCLVKLWKVNV